MAHFRLCCVQIGASGLAALTVLIGLPPRAGATYVTSAASRWSKSERWFTAIAWMPKATVQAALSTVAQVYVIGHREAYATQEDYELDLTRSKIVLTVAIVSIVTTAPTGAIAIFWFGPKLLTNDRPTDGTDSRDVVDAAPELLSARSLDAAVSTPLPDHCGMSITDGRRESHYV